MLTLRVSLLKALYVLAVVATDVLMMRLAWAAAYWLRLSDDPDAEEIVGPLSDYDDLFMVMAACLVASLALARLYFPRRGTAWVDLFFELAVVISVGSVVAIALTAFVYRSLEPPRAMLIYWLLLMVLLVWLGRVVLDQMLRSLRAKGFDVQRVLIVGAGEPAHVVYHRLRDAPELGYRVIGFVDDDPAAQSPGPEPVFGPISMAVAMIKRYQVGELVIANPHLSHQQILELVTTCGREGVDLKIVPDVFQIMASEVRSSELTGLPIMRVRDVGLRGWNLTLKRALDLIVSLVALVLLAPLFVALALLIKVSQRGPAFYSQERVGLDGKPFHLVKFRSMQPDAEEQSGPVWAHPGDERRTALGAFIRRWSLDELPQLVNVLAGEMSLVGPRPERPIFVEQFSRFIPRYAERHNEKAGMTGWAQVNGLRGQTSIEERTKYDVFYVEHWSIIFDIKILLKTLAAVVRDSNAY